MEQTHSEQAVQRLMELYRSVPLKARYKVLCDFEEICAKEKERIK